MGENKIKKIVPYSFILSVFVTIIHNPVKAYYVYGNNTFGNLIHYLISDILPCFTSIAVPSFFVFSAFLFYRTYSLDKTKKKLLSRFKSLVIPFILWNIITLLIEMFTKIPAISRFSIDDSNPFIIENILKGIFLYKYNVFWFVFALILYNLFCPFVYRFLKNKIIGLFTIIVTCIVYIAFLSDKFYIAGSYFQWDSIIYYLIGAFIGIHYKSLLEIKTSKLNSFISIGILFFCVFLECMLSNLPIIIKILITLLKMIAFWCAFDLLDAKESYPWWMSITFFIYASHNFIGRSWGTVFRFFANRLFPIEFSELIAFVFSLFATIGTCILLASVWKKVNLKSFNLFTGNRS
ncbi:MAG: acyltransferase family protein [Erysipelotrichaceae bacterium]